MNSQAQDISSQQRLHFALNGLVLGNRLSMAKAQGLSWNMALQSSNEPVWQDLIRELTPLILDENRTSGPKAALASLNRLEHWLKVDESNQFLRGNSKDFLVDLFILHTFLSEDASHIADDQAWDDFEESCLGKGTDLLHFIHYLDECLADAVHPNMDDFIDSFVISPELEDQDNLLAYEEVLESRELVDAPLLDMIRECRVLASDSAVEPIFTGLFCFLREDSSAQALMETLWQFPDDLSDVLPMLCCVQSYFYGDMVQANNSGSDSSKTISSLYR